MAEEQEVALATLREGKAEVLHKPGEAFYNKAQVQNRDLSIAVIREFIKVRERDLKAKAESGKGAAAAAAGEAAGQGIRILEGLSATGLRAVRYAKEIEGVREVVANDFSKSAVESIQRNIEHNKVEDKVTASHGDASLVMYQNREPATARFDVVDLDPYGTAAPFLDAAVQSVQDGGLLAVTCTDLAVLCGNHSEACHAKYGCTSLRGKHCHEFALRIVLSCIETHANRYKRHIVPLLCVHMDFYVRLFVRVYTSANEVKKSASKQSAVYQCTGCGDYHFQPLGKIVEKGNSVKYLPGNGPPVGEFCEHCGFKHQMGGPIWNQPTKDDSFVDAVKKQLFTNQSEFAGFKRVYGLVTGISEELRGQPLFHDLSVLASHLNASCPPNAVFCSGLVNAGYKYSHSHTNPLAIKTDAPMGVLWDLMRGWVKLHPVRTPKEGSPAHVLLQASNKHVPEPDFTVRPEHKELKKNPGAPKYVPNPEKDWGPMQRAPGYALKDAGDGESGVHDTRVSKRERNQGKNSDKGGDVKRRKEGDGSGEAVSQAGGADVMG